MSYFATVSGRRFNPIQGNLIPLEDSQFYTKNLQSWIEETDGEPGYLWDDGETGTSTELIVASEGAIQSGTSPEDTVLGRAVCSCVETSSCIRVWWAHEPDAHSNVARVDSLQEALELVKTLAMSGNDIGFVLRVSPGASELNR